MIDRPPHRRSGRPPRQRSDAAAGRDGVIRRPERSGGRDRCEAPRGAAEDGAAGRSASTETASRFAHRSALLHRPGCESCEVPSAWSELRSARAPLCAAGSAPAAAAAPAAERCARSRSCAGRWAASATLSQRAHERRSCGRSQRGRCLAERRRALATAAKASGEEKPLCTAIAGTERCSSSARSSLLGSLPRSSLPPGPGARRPSPRGRNGALPSPPTAPPPLLAPRESGRQPAVFCAGAQNSWSGAAPPIPRDIRESRHRPGRE